MLGMHQHFSAPELPYRPDELLVYEGKRGNGGGIKLMYGYDRKRLILGVYDNTH